MGVLDDVAKDVDAFRKRLKGAGIEWVGNSNGRGVQGNEVDGKAVAISGAAQTLAGGAAFVAVLALSQVFQGVALRVSCTTPLGVPTILVRDTAAEPTGSGELGVASFGLVMFRALGGRFHAAAPSVLHMPGAFSRISASLPATLEYASQEKRQAMAALGKSFGCHTCGTRTPATYIADHMPPLKTVKLDDVWRGGSITSVVGAAAQRRRKYRSHRRSEYTMSTTTGRPRPFLDGVFRTACNYCVRSKRGCSGGSPCEQCQKRGKTCTYAQRRMSGPRGRPSGHSHRVRSRARARRQRRAEVLLTAMTGGSPSTENGNLIQKGGHESTAAARRHVSGVGDDGTATAEQASPVGGGEDGRSFGASGRSVRRRGGRGRSGSGAGGRAVGINDGESHYSCDSEYVPSEGWDSDLDAPLASPRSAVSNTGNAEMRQSQTCGRDDQATGRSATANRMQCSRYSSTFSSASSPTSKRSNSVHVTNYDSDFELGQAATFFEEKTAAAIWRRDLQSAPTHLAIQPRTDSHEELPMAHTISCSQSPRPSRPSTLVAMATPLTAAAAAPCRTTFFGTMSFKGMSSRATFSAKPMRMHDQLSIPAPNARLLHSAHLPVPSTNTAAVADVDGTAVVDSNRERIVVAAQGPSTAVGSLDPTARGRVADSVTGSRQNGHHGLSVYADDPHDASRGSWRTAGMYNGSPNADIFPRLLQVDGDDQGKGKSITVESSKSCSKSPRHLSAAQPPSLIPYDEFESGVRQGGGGLAALIDCESVSSEDAMPEGGNAAVLIDANQNQTKRNFQDEGVGKTTGITMSDDRSYKLLKRQHAWKGLANEEDRASEVKMVSALPSWAERTSAVGVDGAGIAEIVQDCNCINDGSSNSNNTSGTYSLTRTLTTTTKDVASAFSAWKEQDALGAVMVQVLPSSTSTNATSAAFPYHSSSPPRPPPHSLTSITEKSFGGGPLPALSGAMAPKPLAPPAQETMMMPTAAAMAPSVIPGFDSCAPVAQISADQRVARANIDRYVSPASLTGTVVAGTELWEEFEDLECATMASMATPLTREESLIRAFEAVDAEFNMTPSACEASAFAAIW